VHAAHPDAQAAALLGVLAEEAATRWPIASQPGACKSAARGWRAAGVGAAIMTQVLPFFDAAIVQTLLEYEAAVYAQIGSPAAT
jgi:hypothetical protein